MGRRKKPKYEPPLTRLRAKKIQQDKLLNMSLDKMNEERAKYLAIQKMWESARVGRPWISKNKVDQNWGKLSTEFDVKVEITGEDCEKRTSFSSAWDGGTAPVEFQSCWESTLDDQHCSQMTEDQILKAILPYLLEEDGSLETRFMSFKQIPVTRLGGMSREDLHLLKNNVTRVLKVHGKEILHLKICSYSPLESVLKYYQRLVEWLTLVPNLKFLHVVGDKSGSFCYCGKGVQDEFQSWRPLPPLPQLESLTLERSCRFHSDGDSVLGALMTSYITNQLHCLSLPPECWTGWNRDKWDHKVSLDMWDSELKITGDWTCATGFDMIALRSVRLKKLEIGVCDHPQANQNLLLQKLNGFQIEVLDITPRYTCPRKKYFSSAFYKRYPSDWTTWSMPLLQTLRMRHELEPVRYEFLGRMTALQNLEILIDLRELKQTPEEWLSREINSFYRRKRRDRSRHKISYEIFRWIYQEHDKDEGLIWELMPTLQKITVSLWIGEKESGDKELDKPRSLHRSIVYTFRKEEYVE